MDFLRLLAADLHALRAEAKRKYPVVKEAVDRALEALPALQQQYAALLRVEGRAPGPGHPLFQSESVLRPFLLACNHTNASHKILVLALASIQRLVSWDAIEPASVGSILRVLQIQAEKNAHADVQVKLLQTLLQLMTLAYEEKKDAGPQDKTKQQTAVQDTGQQQDSELVGNEDMVMQAVWICMHLHATSSSASSVVGNTAAMTIRQLVSLAFGKVHASPEAKHVGVLLFQELCFMSREENGVWLKRTAVSPMSAALGVELLETVLAAHYALFRDDVEFKAVLKQQMTPLVQSVLEMGCNDKSGGSANSGITGPTNTSITSSNTTGAVVSCTGNDRIQTSSKHEKPKRKGHVV
ncbi:Endocytosis and vacuole integrity protein [Phytophthora boehmeriae]|uniref:Endocytosis and vacuole integrity protein n=1 Tax=Phytophthora boehmeriae TaxID=109152 RepID=A0A8T1WXP3_9STRA|nr:Endocytosis and vacuole integrity protein [Phytophthora boehmeriae]